MVTNFPCIKSEFEMTKSTVKVKVSNNPEQTEVFIVCTFFPTCYSSCWVVRYQMIKFYYFFNALIIVRVNLCVQLIKLMHDDTNVYIFLFSLLVLLERHVWVLHLCTLRVTLRHSSGTQWHLRLIPAGFGKEKEKEKKLEDDGNGLNAPQSAFLGPTLWDKTLSYDGDNFQLEYMDLEEFLTENGIPANHQSQNHPSQQPQPPSAPSTPSVVDLSNRATTSVQTSMVAQNCLQSPDRAGTQNTLITKRPSGTSEVRLSAFARLPVNHQQWGQCPHRPTDFCLLSLWTYLKSVSLPTFFKLTLQASIEDFWVFNVSFSEFLTFFSGLHGCPCLWNAYLNSKSYLHCRSSLVSLAAIRLPNHLTRHICVDQNDKTVCQCIADNINSNTLPPLVLCLMCSCPFSTVLSIKGKKSPSNASLKKLFDRSFLLSLNVYLRTPLICAYTNDLIIQNPTCPPKHDWQPQWRQCPSRLPHLSYIPANDIHVHLLQGTHTRSQVCFAIHLTCRVKAK